MSKLEEAKEITSSEYTKLDDPVFEGQTLTNDKGIYWLLFSTPESGLVKVKHNLLD